MTGACWPSTRSRARSSGSTAASSASSRRCSTTWRRGSVLEREPFARPGCRAAQLRAFRHEGFWDCMDTYKDAATLNDLWAAGRGAVEAVEAMNGESVFVTGADGLLGLVADRAPCWSAAPRVTVLRARPPGRCRRWRWTGIEDAGERRRAATCSDGAAAGPRAGRLRGGHASSTSPPRRWWATPRARRSPPSRPTCAEPGRVLEACRAHGAERVVVASSDKAYGAQADAALPRGPAAWTPATPTTSPRPPPT